MKKFFVTACVLLLIVGTGLGIWTATKPKAQEGGDGEGGRGDTLKPLSVKVQTVERRAMPLVLETVGTVQSEHSVEIRPQVSGTLQEVLFEEGQHVEAGQLLFKIDPSTFEAAVQQAQANLARDSAQTKQARAQLNRLAPLVDQEYITREEYDLARATADAAQSTEAANRALLEQAKIQLEYALIRAPIAGRTGVVTVRAGNLVGPSNTEPLLTINQIKPALVQFTIPQQNLDELRRYNETGDVTAEILRGDKTGPALGQGPLVFIDNNVNVETGTITLKARIPNDNESLLPGQFVAVNLILTVEPNAVVIPEGLVQPGQQGPYVYLADEGKVRMQPIVVARQMGDQMVIAKGLNGGEQIITQHPRNIAAGMPVEIENADADETKPAQKTDSGSV